MYMYKELHSKLKINAVKGNLMELIARNACIPVVVSSVLMCACTRIPCAPAPRCAGSLHSDSVYSEYYLAWEDIFKHPPSLPLSIVNLVLINY